MYNHHLQSAARNLARWRMLAYVYENRVKGMSLELLINMLSKEFALSADNVLAETNYLIQRKFMTCDAHHLFQMTWQGVDLVEFTSACPPSIARPAESGESSTKRHTRMMIRGRCLHTLGVSSAFAMNDELIANTVSDLHYPVSQEALRAELRYLAWLELITLDDQQAQWLAQLTANGTDVIQGAAPSPAGIAPRPMCNADLA